MKKYVTILLLSFSMACASLPISKDKAIAGLQTSNVALAAAADAERALCFVNPQVESGPHCTNPLAAVAGLTDARHASATDLLIAGFKDEKLAAVALSVWQPGQALPTDVAAYQADATNVLAVAKVLDANGASFLAKAQSAVDEAAKVLIALGVK